MVLANPTIIELDMGKLDDLRKRIDARELRCGRLFHDSVPDRIVRGPVLRRG